MRAIDQTIRKYKAQGYNLTRKQAAIVAREDAMPIPANAISLQEWAAIDSKNAQRKAVTRAA